MADSGEIVGWFYKSGRRVPLRKGNGNAAGRFGNTGVVGFAAKKRGDKLKRPVVVTEEQRQASIKLAKEMTRKAAEHRRLAKTSIMNQVMAQHPEK